MADMSDVLKVFSEAETYNVKILGVRPLLMHAPVGIGNKPKLRRGEYLDPKAEAEMYLYKNDKGEICIPAANIKACIREAGKNYRVGGRKVSFATIVKAGLMIEPAMVPLIDPKTGAQPQWVVDYRPVVVQKNRIMRARPRFDSWSLEFRIINLDPTVIHKDTLRKILIDAGRFCGLGDYRPEFGLFVVEKFD